MSRKQKGFSLVEMLVVVAIIMVLSAMAAPTLLRSIRRYQTETSVRSVANILSRARYEAINRNQRIPTLFRTPVQATEGARYGIDINRNGTLDAGEPFIILNRQVTFYFNNTTPIAWGTFQFPDYNIVTAPSAPPWSMSYSAQGTLLTQSGGVWNLAPNVQGIALMQGTFADTNWEIWLITVTPAGRIRTWMYANNTGTWRPVQ